MNATDLGNKPAFPSHGSMGEVVREGITHREWLIGMAMQGLIAHFGAGELAATARIASDVADAILAREAQEAGDAQR